MFRHGIEPGRVIAYPQITVEELSMTGKILLVRKEFWVPGIEENGLSQRVRAVSMPLSDLSSHQGAARPKYPPDVGVSRNFSPDIGEDG